MEQNKQLGPNGETPEEKAERIRRQQIRKRKQRLHRRNMMMMRGCLIGLVLLFVIGILVLISGNEKDDDKDTNQDGSISQEPVEVLKPVLVEDVLFLSFQTLIADTDLAFDQEDEQMATLIEYGHLTVREFESILQSLYEQNYILIDMKQLFTTDEDENLQMQQLMIPEAKKPLVIIQQNLSYPLDESGCGFASRLVVDEDGKVKCELKNTDGSTSVGNYDVIPIVNDFILQHPDFSRDGARGIVGLTGYNGILGYRTAGALAVSENNVYAGRFGLFDTAQEIELVKPVVEALKKEGWHFACNGFAFTSYTKGLKTVKNDVEKWKKEVGALIGNTDILLYPNGVDISNWTPYSLEDEKYSYLKEQGFQYFMNLDMNGSWVQVTDSYARFSYQTLDGYRMVQDLYYEMGRFTDLFSFESIWDEQRPVRWEANGDETSQNF